MIDKLKEVLKKAKDIKGQAMVEYALIIAAIAIVVVLAAKNLGEVVTNFFNGFAAGI